jgi:hypothetical protein
MKAKSRNALLRLLMVFICSYLKSVLRYIVLILDAYHEDTRREQECDHPCLLIEDKNGSASKQKFGILWSKRLRKAHMAVPSPRASHTGGPGSIPGKLMRKLWTKLNWDRFSSEHAGFPLSLRAQWPTPKLLNDDTASVMH